MKECPQCHEVFNDDVKFCELHGVELIGDDLSDLQTALVQSTARRKTDISGVLATAFIGVLIGVCLCLAVYAFVVLPGAGRTEGNGQEAPRALAAGKSNQTITQLPAARPTLSPTPAEFESQEASPSPTPVASPTSEKTVSPMNDGPISTGTKHTASEAAQTVIKMKDGSSIQADAAWEDSQGIWYRRGALVSFVERSRIEKITVSPQSTAAPEAVKK